MGITIDRMEIDDAGGNPTKLAQAVLKQLPDLTPPVPIREIAAALDIYEIREAELRGIEGGLITPEDKSEGAILVREDRPEKRKRYTIGHELGHYVNPWHRPATADGFRCTARDMAAERFTKADRAKQMEVEANQFAAELLMPPGLFGRRVKRLSGVDIEQIVKLSDDFLVSREAAARRFIQYANEPLAVIFSKDGVIRYTKKHEDFPALDVWARSPLPPGSLSVQSKLEIGNVSDWGTRDGGAWLRDCAWKEICEQTLAQRNGFRLTLLALDEEYFDGDDEDKEERNWDEPKFRH